MIFVSARSEWMDNWASNAEGQPPLNGDIYLSGRPTTDCYYDRI